MLYKEMELFMKVETDIIAWLAASLIGRAVIMSVETFQTGVSVFLIIFMMCMTSQRPIIFSIRINALILSNILQ
jgi:hypothetical protein